MYIINKLPFSQSAAFLLLWTSFRHIRMTIPVPLTQADLIRILWLDLLLWHQLLPQSTKSIQNLVPGPRAYLSKQRDVILQHESFQIRLSNCIYRHIWFVGQNHDLAIWFSVFVDLCYPEFGNLLKTEFVIDCIDENYSIGPSVVGWNDRSKCLRPSSIPNLHFDFFSLDFQGLEFKVNANSGKQVFGENIINESKKERALADSRTTSYDDLISLVVVFEHLFWFIINLIYKFIYHYRFNTNLPTRQVYPLWSQALFSLNAKFS